MSSPWTSRSQTATESSGPPTEPQSPDVYLDRMSRRLGRRGAKALDRDLAVLLEPQTYCDDFFEADNERYNGVSNVLLYDDTRVKLTDGLHKSDYIHASWVDGFARRNQYILCQAPNNDDAERNLWRLVRQCEPPLLVLLSIAPAAHLRRHVEFWPTTDKDKHYLGGALRVHTEELRLSDAVDVASVVVQVRGDRQVHHVLFMHYRLWTGDDKTVPASLAELPTSMSVQLSLHAKRWPPEDRRVRPIMFVCATGVHRCGTLAAHCINMDRLAATNKVAVKKTVRDVRRQRYGCVRHLSQYKWLNKAVATQALRCGIVDPANIVDANPDFLL